MITKIYILEELIKIYNKALVDIPQENSFDDVMDYCFAHSIAKGVCECVAVVICKSSDEMLQAHLLTEDLYRPYYDYNSRWFGQTPHECKLFKLYSTKENVLGCISYRLDILKEIYENESKQA